MKSSIALFDTSFGIQSVMQDQNQGASMPIPQQLASTVMSDVGLEDLYLPVNSQRLLEAALCPEVGDGKLVQPDTFAVNLKGCLESLKGSKDPDVRSFVRKDLTPMLDDAALLNSYAGLLISG